ncbi:MAG: glycosyltransferase family 4 protein [Planctomycetes bacterium]|nr:glycosyltransferase family 4 protein [Planctomycetota bacterium]
MKLLFLTQVLDRGDAVLGFVPRWIEGFARCTERVRVVALEVGDTSGLPANVDWREVGRRGVIRRYLRYRSILKEALESDGFDAVLAHMVPRYASVARPFARKSGARLYLWYTHGAVDARLRRAVDEVDKAFTATRDSLRIESPKVVVTGHGIDLAHFDPRGAASAEPPILLSVGRLTPSKDPLTVIEALARLRAHGRDVRLEWAGGGLAAGDSDYRRVVEARIAELGLGLHVTLHGAVPYRDVPSLYARASVIVNSSHTGSLDKVVLEAMAAARPVVSCNDSFGGVIAELGGEARELAFAPRDPVALAAALERLLARPATERAALGARLRALVAREHEVDRLMARLVREMEA